MPAAACRIYLVALAAAVSCGDGQGIPRPSPRHHYETAADVIRTHSANRGLPVKDVPIGETLIRIRREEIFKQVNRVITITSGQFVDVTGAPVKLITSKPPVTFGFGVNHKPRFGDVADLQIIPVQQIASLSTMTRSQLVGISGTPDKLITDKTKPHHGRGFATSRFFRKTTDKTISQTGVFGDKLINKRLRHRRK